MALAEVAKKRRQAPESGNQNAKLYKFKLRDRIFNDLYLNTKMSDVNFLLPKVIQETPSTSDDVEFVKIPAHKFILAAASDAFYAMFFGPTKETGDVKITDSYADAFKEFLQCFYLREGTFTKENVSQVISLANKYMINECLAACNSFLKDNLTPNDVCCVYGLAILVDRPDLKESCEKIIIANAGSVLCSPDFIDCDRKMLAEILNLDLEYREIDVLNDCLAWAKNACRKSGLDENSNENLRNQLGDCFLLIRFGSMKMEELSECISKNPGLFRNDELEEALKFLGLKGFKSTKFIQKPRLNWNERRIWLCRPNRLSKSHIGQLGETETVRITSNETILLGGIHGCLNIDYDATVKIIEKFSESEKILFSGVMPFKVLKEVHTKLPTPIMIKEGVTYVIQFEFYGYEIGGLSVKFDAKSEVVQSPKGTRLTFDSDGNCHLISCLEFMDP